MLAAARDSLSSINVDCAPPTRTFFPDAKQTVKLEFGEFLLHPGQSISMIILSTDIKI